MNPTTRAILVVSALQLIFSALVLISLRMQYQRRRLAAARAGAPAPARPLLYLVLCAVWLVCAAQMFTIYIVFLA